MNRLFITGLALLIAFAPTEFSWADTGSEIDNLKERIRALETRQEREPTDEATLSLISGAKKVTFSGLLELSADYRKSQGQKTSSNLEVATAQLQVAMTANENIGGHISLLYEESSDDQAINADEAIISLHCPHKLFDLAPTLNGGRLYLPFGNYASSMVTDPLTLELGQTSNTAVVFGLEGESLHFQVGIFSGEVDRNTGAIDSFVAALVWCPQEDIRLGASYLSDLAESDAELVANPNSYDANTQGLSAFASFGLGHFTLSGEIVAALDDVDPALINADNDGDGLADTNLSGPRPRAWVSEISWSPAERWQVAGRYEKSLDFLGNQTRYGMTASYGLFADTVLALEYLNGTSKAAATAQTVTLQLAFNY